MGNVFSLKNWDSRIRLFLAFVFLVIGLGLLAINVYGLGQQIRKPGLGVQDKEKLRFVPDSVWSYEKSLSAINGLSEIEERKKLVERANQIVNKSLVHIEWNKVDASEYRQLIPIWENYYLWFIGQFSGLPQFERYHYADYQRNIERGIGICGDASTILSSVLDEYGVENRIVSFQGHVVVEYEAEGGANLLADPDFGVLLNLPLSDLSERQNYVRSQYQSAGYSDKEINTLLSIYDKGYVYFEDTYSFMMKRYLFEYASYVAKWILPLVLVVTGLIFLRALRRADS